MRELVSSVSSELTSVAQEAADKIANRGHNTSGTYAQTQNEKNGEKYITDNTGRIYDRDSGAWVGDAASGWYPADYAFDSGGILRGIGGIKATAQDEMVLPPSTTSKLLNAEVNGAFDALLDHLGIVTAAGESYAGIGGSVSRTTIGTQNNGDTFSIGGITISEAQARGTTVYELAQMARGLSLHTT